MCGILGIVSAGERIDPAVNHVDDTGRVQTVSREENRDYYDVIKAVGERTGAAVVLNTSFNENEPIVCRPEEGIDCYLRTKMDALAIGSTTVSVLHPSGVRSAVADDARARVLALTDRVLEPAMVTARVGETVRFTYTGTLSDGTPFNLTQRASYSTNDWTIVQPQNVSGDRSAYTCMAAGTAEVHAWADDIPNLIGMFFPTRATLVCTP